MAKDEFQWPKGTKKLAQERKKRFEVMLAKKRDLKINEKCDRMDALYTPHLTNLDGAGNVELQTSDQFNKNILVSDKARKSMPLAFEKITTAQALMIKENPKGVLHVDKTEYQNLNPLIENVYYENFRIQRKIRVLRKYVYQLAKYGVAYWREYIKKTYKKRVDYNDVGEMEANWVYDVFDVVGENIHPKNVILDDGCLGVKDVNKPANDLVIHLYLTEMELKAIYPEKEFPNVKFIQEGQKWMIDTGQNKEREIDGRAKIQILIYENRYDCLRETWVNGYPLESVPLPGGELSISGGKWVEDGDNYNGIGVGQICEIYTPLLDDIINCSLERLRQLVRPNEDWFNGTHLTDESDMVDFGSGNVRKFSGSPNDIVYSTPPPRNPQEAQEKEELLEEIDRATMIPRNLAGTDDAKTAYQAAQNRESALKKLSLPLDVIKDTIEDAANLDLNLYPIIYAEPIETRILKAGDSEFDEAQALLVQADEQGVSDERVVPMANNQIARREFRKMELPLAMEQKDNVPTGRVVEADEKEFWEMIPKHFNWQGRIEIIAESFLPISKALEDEQKKEALDYLLGVPTTDEMGRPVLMNAQGQPFTIDKVRVIKERTGINRHFDPDKFIVPLNQKNMEQGTMENPLEEPTELSPTEKVNATRPEVAGTEALANPLV